MFCIGISQSFFDLPRSDIPDVFASFKAAFGNLEERFGIVVLGTLDDDRIQVGQSSAGWPFTSYIMADVPDLETVAKVCDQLRTTPVGDGLLWRYARIDTRIGRPVFPDADACRPRPAGYAGSGGRLPAPGGAVHVAMRRAADRRARTRVCRPVCGRPDLGRRGTAGWRRVQTVRGARQADRLVRQLARPAALQFQRSLPHLRSDRRFLRPGRRRLDDVPGGAPTRRGSRAARGADHHGVPARCGRPADSPPPDREPVPPRLFGRSRRGDAVRGRRMTIFVQLLDIGGSGLRTGVKDTIDIAGIPTRCGSRALAGAPPAAANAVVVARLLQAGCRIVGKTVLHELAFGVRGLNGLTATPINPHHPDRIPGG